MPAQMSSGRRVPRHLPSGRGVSGHYSFRTQSVKATVVWTACATASVFRTRSVWALFFPDAECQGNCPPDDACHGICQLDDARHGVRLPDEECQGIFPSGRRVSRQMTSGRFTRVPRHLSSGRGVSGHFSFRTQRVSYSGRLSRQMSSGRRVPRHLPSGRGVLMH